MSIDLGSTYSSWEGVERSLADLRCERDNLEAFFSHELEELDTLRCELVDRNQKLDEERGALTEQCQQLEKQHQDLEQRQSTLENQQQHLDEERVLLDEQHQAKQADVDSLEDKSRRLAEANAELAQVRAKLADEVDRSQAEQKQSEQAWREQIEQLEEERKQLSEQLAATEGEATRAAEAKQALGELQSQFDSVQAELVERRNAQPPEPSDPDEELQGRLQALLEERSQWQRDLEGARAEAAGDPEIAAKLSAAEDELSSAQGEIESLREQLTVVQTAQGDHTQQHIAELEEDRTALELELEAVRNRASELADDAAEEKRRAAEERAEWAVELKQLRKAMESQARVLKENDSVHEVVAGNGNGGGYSEVAGSNGDDPVLDSLMNQFQQLQKDRIQRRANARVAAQQEVA